MDLYLASSDPAITLQEMIDWDIKSGIDFDADPLMTSIDLSAMTSLEADFALRPFETLFDPLERSEEDEAMETCGGTRPSPLTGDTSPVASWMNLSAMTNFNLDAETSLMVNPSVVLPSPHHLPMRGAEPSPPPTPTTRKHPSGDSCSSSSSSSSSSISDIIINPPASSPATTHVVFRPTPTTTTTLPSTLTPPPSHPGAPSFVSATSSSPNPIVTTSSPAALRHIATTTTPIHTAAHHHKQVNTTSGVTLSTSTSAIPVYQNQTSRSVGVSFTPTRSKPLQKYRRDRTPEEKSYPKPAYSYACLIALALKNSMTGSLPVSEIYSFMCEHFPYFRTAPNGWKNSVRHNLSLNKCFEKIEKPVVSGNNQRKGCLWALNPLKAHKMDEEVQKWSKKDLQGIRDAMTCPEVLESLERGEMKFEASSGASSCSEDEEDEETILDDHSPIKVISATPVVIPQSGGNGPSRVVPQNGFRSSPKPVQLQELNLISNASASPHHGVPQQGVRRTISSSPEPEFILPDSTMSEINIQSNGAMVDDFGNEITLEGDLSILNPRVTAAVSSSGGTNLILKKVSASPLRNSSAVRSNFMYAATPAATSNTPLLPHQNGLNRLVLTNAKLS